MLSSQPFCKRGSFLLFTNGRTSSDRRRRVASKLQRKEKQEWSNVTLVFLLLPEEGKSKRWRVWSAGSSLTGCCGRDANTRPDWSLHEGRLPEPEAEPRLRKSGQEKLPFNRKNSRAGPGSDGAAACWRNKPQHQT